MMHQPIILKNLALSFAKKCCFEDFSAEILPHSRIAIIGKNGSGKSSLLDILRGALAPTEGDLIIPANACFAHVPQTIAQHHSLSGGQRLNNELTKALAKAPNILLLDEPTNHLDQDNRKALMRMIKHFYGTVIVVSHDVKLLSCCVDSLWHIDDGKIHQFSGAYEDYIQQQQHLRNHLAKELALLKAEKQAAHVKLMKEQNRAAASRMKGKKSIGNKKWPTVVSTAKAHRAEKTSGKKKSAIDKKKKNLTQQLSQLRLPEIITPKFELSYDHKHRHQGLVLSISNATVGYSSEETVLHELHLSLGSQERIAIGGKNASGKSSLLKAIANFENIVKTGDWHIPKASRIGYLDQHYNNLIEDISVFNNLKHLRPYWSDTEIRQHLNDFLFRKNEEVFCLASTLSGGEKARLSLCLISAKVPQLLLLDEITNNLDLETKAHLSQILRSYPGSMIVVSHDDNFLSDIALDQYYDIDKGKLKRHAQDA